MLTLALLGFWVALATLVYVFAGFPVLLAATARVLDRRTRHRGDTPSLSLIIAAYNEQDVIEARLDNALAADFPPGALEIIVASDGSTDRTRSIVAGYADRGVRLLDLPRRGKIFALNDAVRSATGAILVFSDANTMVEPHALRKIARHFSDPQVGGVAGQTGYTIQEGSESSSSGESLYWRYDTWLKTMESRTGSIVSAHGGLYAVRRELYQPPTDAAVTDDFMISTAVVAQGFRLVFEPAARAWEVAVPKSDREFQRRVRLMTRGIRGVVQRRALLNPFRFGFYAIVLLTHKVLRRLVPPLLLVLLGCSLVLHGIPFFRAALLFQTTFYAMALIGFWARKRQVGLNRVLLIPFFFCMANLAALIALARFITGERIDRWEPQRHAEITELGEVTVSAVPTEPTVSPRATTNGAHHSNHSVNPMEFDVAGLLVVHALDAGALDLRALERQLGKARHGVTSDPDITLRFVDRLPHRHLQHVEVGRSAFTADGYMIRAAGGADRWVRVPFADAGGPCEFVCERGTRIVPLLKQFLRLRALARGYLPFHASAFEWRGRGVLVAGWSHGGKTSALLAFGANGARYIGDDLVLVSADGRIMHGLAAPIGLSSWHIGQMPQLRSAVPNGKRICAAASSRLSRVATGVGRSGGLLGQTARIMARIAERGSRLTLPIETIFQAGRLGSARPDKLFLMLSADQPRVSVEPTTAGTVGARMSHSLEVEAGPLHDHYQAYRYAAIGEANVLIERRGVEERRLLESALSGADSYLVRHPYPAPFGQLFHGMRPACEATHTSPAASPGMGRTTRPRVTEVGA